MANYVIAFDMNTKDMKDEGVSHSERTRIYQEMIPHVLKDLGFEHIQGSVWMAQEVPENIEWMKKQLLGKMAIRGQQFFVYHKHMRLFRVEEWLDLAPEVATVPPEQPTGG